MSRTIFIQLVLVGAVFTISTACLYAQTPVAAPTPTPAAKFSTADLEKLRWIEGTWRGTGDVEAPFFERYRFESPTTLAVDGFTDETLSKVDDTTRFELKDGQFGNGGEGSRWTASALDNQSITFVPLVKAKNSFRWQRESDNTWTAILTWPAQEGKPSRQRVYKMEKWPK